MAIVISVIITLIVYSYVIILLAIKYKMYKHIELDPQICETCKWWSGEYLDKRGYCDNREIHIMNEYSIKSYKDFGCPFHKPN